MAGIINARLNITIGKSLPLLNLLTMVHDLVVAQQIPPVLDKQHFNEIFLTEQNWFRLTIKHCSWDKPNENKKIMTCATCNLATLDNNTMEKHSKAGLYSIGHMLYLTGQRVVPFFLLTILASFSFPHNSDLASCFFCDTQETKRNLKRLYHHASNEHGYLLTNFTYESEENTLRKLEKQYSTNSKEIKLEDRGNFCFNCTAYFATTSDLLLHLQSKPHRMSYFYCPQCNVSYLDMQETHILRRHIKEIFCPIRRCCSLDFEDLNLYQHAQDQDLWQISTTMGRDVYRDVLERSYSFQEKIILSEAKCIPVENGFIQYPSPTTREIVNKILHNPNHTMTLDRISQNTAEVVLSIFHILPYNIPLAMRDIIAKQFPRILNTEFTLPQKVECNNIENMFIAKQVSPHKSTLPKYETVLSSFPVIIFGSTVLRGINLMFENLAISQNESSPTTLHWPTNYSFMTTEKPFYHLKLDKDEQQFRTNYFQKLGELFENNRYYEGLLFIEADIQHCLSDTFNEDIIIALAKSYCQHLVAMKNRPKKNCSVGSSL